MYTKVILSLVLVAFVSVQLAYSLKCFTCDTPKSCKSPLTVKCDQAAANKTRDVLKSYYSGVKENLNSKDFQCFVGRSQYKNVTTMSVGGCIMKGSIGCTNALINKNYTNTFCNTCHKDLCNKTNSVGTLSSSFVTAIVLMVVAKVFIY